MKKTISILFAFVFLSTGCSQKSASFKASYSTPLEYKKLNCQQIEEEAIEINQQLHNLEPGLDDYVGDIVGGAFIILISGGFYGPDLDEDPEVSKLKEDFKFLKKVATEKNCSFADEMQIK